MGASESSLLEVNPQPPQLQFKKALFTSLSNSALKHALITIYIDINSHLQRSGDEITIVSQRSESIDPVLERLRSLQIANPILEALPAERSLTDILVRKPLLSSNSSTVDPQVLLELFSIYRDWQEKKTQNVSKRQEEVENKINVADALAVKLLQCFNYSVSAMRTSSNHLSEVHLLQVELGELKGRLTEVISNCDALCQRIAADGPESLKSTIKPFVLPLRTHQHLQVRQLD